MACSVREYTNDKLNIIYNLQCSWGGPYKAIEHVAGMLMGKKTPKKLI